jgi:demethylmenaquinone methyltransferase / 2-methoxy-6-polyprenyl-1,4-benzoquinol methylase
MARARLDKRPRDVATMFDLVAERYDLLNDVLSMGQDRRWRRAVAAAVGARPGERVLDLAAGTGAVSRVLAQAGADCVACDFSFGMLEVGAMRLARSGRPGPPGPGGNSPAAAAADGQGAVRFVAGDALALPLRDGAFDAVTISFGLRNVADPAAALAEMRRVTKPGGRLLICEFSHLGHGRLDALYQRYLAVALPAVARRLSPNPDAYVYLAESIGAWPGQEELAALIRAAGWSAVRWRSLSFGIVALHDARNGVGPAQAGGVRGGSQVRRGRRSRLRTESNL